MKTKSMFVGFVLAIFALPLLFLFSACGEQEQDVESKLALTADMIHTEQTSFTYDGEVQKPRVSVYVEKQGKRQVFAEGVDYEIVWEDANSTNVKTGADPNYHFTVKAKESSTKLEGQAEGKSYYIGALDLSNRNDKYVELEVEDVTFDLDHIGDYRPDVRIKNAKTGKYFDSSIFTISYSGNTLPTTSAMVTITPTDRSDANFKNQATKLFEIKKADISKAKITFGDATTENFTAFYTGKPISVNDILKVTYRLDTNGDPIYIPYGENFEADTPELQYGFTIEYDENTTTVVGTAHFVVRAHVQNPYLQGEVSKTFTISKCVFDDSFQILDGDKVLDEKDYYYIASPNPPQITVKSSKILTEDNTVAPGSYTRTYFKWGIVPETQQEGWIELVGGALEIEEVGRYKVEINGRGNFEGKVSQEFQIKPTDISGGTIKYIVNGEEVENFETTFTGFPIVPDAKLLVNVGEQTKEFVSSTTLLKVEYQNHENAASADDVKAPTIKFTGMGGFTGSVEKNFTITPVSLSSDRIVVGNIENQVFSNSAKTPQFEISLLNENNNAYVVNQTKDVEVSYGENIFGDVEVTIEAIQNGNFTGQTQTSFTIVKANLEDASFADILAKNFDFENEITLSADDITGTFAGYNLVFNQDFSLSYEDNVHAGTATVTITGGHYFEGEVTKTFDINPISYTSQTDGEDLTQVEKNGRTFNLVGNEDFTSIFVDAENVVISGTSKVLLETQSITVLSGKSLTLNCFVGSKITNQNVDTAPLFDDPNFDPEELSFKVVQNNVTTKEELESAMRFANLVRLGADIEGAVELLKELDGNSDSNTSSNDSVVVVRKFDLNGYDLLGNEFSTNQATQFNNKNFVVNQNKTQNLSAFLLLTNSSEEESVVGSDRVFYGLEIQGGHYTGSGEAQDMNLAIVANNLTFRGRNGGLLTNGEFENTFDDETGQGLMLLLSFDNCKFESVSPVGHVIGGIMTCPPSAIFNANADVMITSSTFDGDSGIFVKAGDLFVEDCTINANSTFMANVEKTYGSSALLGFGTGSGLIVESTSADIPVVVYVKNSSIFSNKNNAVEEYKLAGLNEDTEIVLEGVTLNGAQRQFALEDQRRKDLDEMDDVLTAIDVSVNPANDSRLTSALTNEGYHNQIVNKVNVYSDFTIGDINVIYAGKVVVYTGATLTVSHYYPQIETAKLSEDDLETGKINFLASVNPDQSSTDVIGAIENEFFDKMSLNAGIYELLITQATSTIINASSNVKIIIKEGSVASELDKLTFNFINPDSTLVLEDYFADSLHASFGGIAVEQHNIKTADALKHAVTYAQTISLGADIETPQDDDFDHHDYRLTLFENTQSQDKIDITLDTKGFDIFGYLKLSAAKTGQDITLVLKNTETEKSLIGGENAQIGIQIFGGQNFDAFDSSCPSCNMTVTLQNLLVKGLETGLSTYENFVKGQNYSASLVATNCNFESLDKVLSVEEKEYALAGLYAPAYATYQFNNCSFSGGMGAYIKGGELTFNNSVFTANAGVSQEKKEKISGYFGTGSAIVVDTDTNYASDAIKVTLNGADIYSDGRFALEEFSTYGTVNDDTLITLKGIVNVSSKLGAFENATASALSFDGNAFITASSLYQDGFAKDILDENIDVLNLSNDEGTLVFEIPKTVSEINAGTVNVLEGVVVTTHKFFDLEKLGTNGLSGGAINLCTAKTSEVANVLTAITNSVNYTKINLFDTEFNFESWEEIPETLTVVVDENANVIVSKFFEALSSQNGGEITLLTTSQNDLNSALKSESYQHIKILENAFALAITEENASTSSTEITLDENASLTLSSTLLRVLFNVKSGSSLVLENVLTNDLSLTKESAVYVEQRNVLSSAELENAVTYANKIVLGGNILGRVELLKDVQANSNIDVTIDLYGHDILTGNSRLFVSEWNETEGICANITITSTNGNSFIGNRAEDEFNPEQDFNTLAPYGLDIRGGDFRKEKTGANANLKGFNLTLNVSNVTLQGQLGGAIVRGDFGSTYVVDEDTHEESGFKFDVNFSNVTFNATEKEDLYTQTNTMYTPAGAYFAGNANINAIGCTFRGGTGLYVKAGNVNLVNANIYATEIPDGFEYKQTTPNNNGYYGNGSAFVLDSHSSYASPAHITINGVNFESQVGYAIDEYRSYGSVEGNPTITLEGYVNVNRTGLGFAHISSGDDVLSILKGEEFFTNLNFSNISNKDLFEDALLYADSISLSGNLDYSENGLNIDKSISIYGTYVGTDAQNETEHEFDITTITGTVTVSGTQENPVNVNLSNIKIVGTLVVNEYARVSGYLDLENTSGTAIVVNNGAALELWGGNIKSATGIYAKQGCTVNLSWVMFDVTEQVALIETEEFSANNIRFALDENNDNSFNGKLVLNSLDAKAVVSYNISESTATQDDKYANEPTISSGIAGAIVLVDDDGSTEYYSNKIYTLFDGVAVSDAQAFLQKIGTAEKIALRGDIELTLGTAITIGNNIEIIGFGHSITGNFVIEEGKTFVLDNLTLLTNYDPEKYVLDNNGTVTLKNSARIVGNIRNSGEMSLLGTHITQQTIEIDEQTQEETIVNIDQISSLSGNITNTGSLTIKSFDITGNITNSGSLTMISCGTLVGNITSTAGTVAISTLDIDGDIVNSAMFSLTNSNVEGSITFERTALADEMILENVKMIGEVDVNVSTSGLILKGFTQDQATINLDGSMISVISDSEVDVVTTLVNCTVWTSVDGNNYIYQSVSFASINYATDLKTIAENDEGAYLLIIVSDLTLNNTITISRDLVVDGQGNSISGTGNIVVTNDAKVVFKNLYVTLNETGVDAAVQLLSGSLDIQGGSISGNTGICVGQSATLNASDVQFAVTDATQNDKAIIVVGNATLKETTVLTGKIYLENEDAIVTTTFDDTTGIIVTDLEEEGFSFSVQKTENEDQTFSYSVLKTANEQ